MIKVPKGYHSFGSHLKLNGSSEWEFKRSRVGMQSKGRPNGELTDWRGGGGDPDLIHLLNKKTHYTSDIWAAVRITSSQRCSTQTPTFIGTQQQQQDAPNAVPPFSAIFPTLNDQNLLNVTLL